MYKIILKLSTTLLAGLFFPAVYGQQVVTAAGGEATGTAGHVSFTIGQVFYSGQSDLAGNIQEGVQQPYEIYVVTGIGHDDGLSLAITAYPNPATDMLTLKVEGAVFSVLAVPTLYMYDISGKLLLQKNLDGPETVVPVTGFLPGVYFLYVYDTGDHANVKILRIFKIIKNQSL